MSNIENYPTPTITDPVYLSLASALTAATQTEVQYSIIEQINDYMLSVYLPQQTESIESAQGSFLSDIFPESADFNTNGNVTNAVEAFLTTTPTVHVDSALFTEGDAPDATSDAVVSANPSAYDRADQSIDFDAAASVAGFDSSFQDMFSAAAAANATATDVSYEETTIPGSVIPATTVSGVTVQGTTLPGEVISGKTEEGSTRVFVSAIPLEEAPVPADANHDDIFALYEDVPTGTSGGNIKASPTVPGNLKAREAESSSGSMSTNAANSPPLVSTLVVLCAVFQFLFMI